jgi:hypothetical protein
MILRNSTQRKPVGILLGSHFGIEREIIEHFSLAGYELCHAPTIADARMYFEGSDYDFIFCFENFVGEPTLDFVYSLSQEKFKKVIALVENGKLSSHRRGEGPEISHFFYVRTSPAILQFFIELISGMKCLRVEACSN